MTGAVFVCTVRVERILAIRFLSVGTILEGVRGGAKLPTVAGAQEPAKVRHAHQLIAVKQFASVYFYTDEDLLASARAASESDGALWLERASIRNIAWAQARTSHETLISFPLSLSL